MKDAGRAKVLLVGNPNVGKSVIFGFLTGRYTVVSNYPGTTVEVSSGAAAFDKSIEVVDTPGVNSLMPQSEDERVTRDIILRNREATVVQVADAKNLRRALLLTSQLAEIGVRAILVLNMVDEARQRGILIDGGKLSEILGIPVLETVAVERRGLQRLVHEIAAGAARPVDLEIPYGGAVGEWLRTVDGILGGGAGYSRFDALSYFAGEREPLEKRVVPGVVAALEERLRAIRRGVPKHPSWYIAEARRGPVERITDTVIGGRKEKEGEGRTWRLFAPSTVLAAASVVLYASFGVRRLADGGLHPTLLLLLAVSIGVALAGKDRINGLTLHPVSGPVILIIVLYIIYQLVGVFAAGTVVDLLENGLFGRLIVPAVDRAVGGGRLGDFLTGDYGLVSVGLNYSVSIVLPIVSVFFLVFGVLEDTGYFPRLTVLTNRVFRLVGVSGKATLPIVLGFGCVTMAVLAARIMESRKERLIVVALLALAVPCSAQLGVILALLSALSPGAVLLISAIILAEFVLAGRLLSRLIPGRPTDFILELPPLRVPRPGNILLKTGARIRWFLKEALPFFLLATVLLYLLDLTGGLAVVFRLFEPVVGRLLGLPKETAAMFIVGFFRRDYGAAGLYKLWESGALAGNQLVVAVTVLTLFLPCLASLIVMIKEHGVRQSLLILAMVMTASLLTGGLLNLALGALGARF